jgi:ArsR family transcriptional regulator
MVPNRHVKEFCKDYARLFKALANPIRLEIICQLLCSEERCVKDLTEALGRKQANISQHLAILRNLGVVDFTRRENTVCYHFKDSRLRALLEGFIPDQMEREQLRASRVVPKSGASPKEPALDRPGGGTLTATTSSVRTEEVLPALEGVV